MSVFYLIYTSKITLPASFHQSTFYDICEQASRNNPKFGIGGFLCFKCGYFLQYIEGEESAINNLFSTLLSDKRHKSIEKVSEGFKDNALFAKWEMHCINLDKVDDIDSISPVLDYFETTLFSDKDTPKLLEDLGRYYANGAWVHQTEYAFDKGSYSKSAINRFGKTHAIFLWLQVGLVILFIALLFLAWLYNDYWITALLTNS